MNKTNLIIFLLLLQISCTAIAQNIFVSPDGNDSNTGTTLDDPLQTVQIAMSKVSATDTVFLLPGRYFQNIRIEDIHGIPEFPVVVQSFAIDSSNFAIIDGGSAPGMELDHVGMQISNSSWLVVQNLIFENCWTDIIPIQTSSYISFRNCIFMGGRRVIYPKGNGCHHFLIEKCYWEQDERVWNTWDWQELHHGSLQHYNGALFHPKETNGNFIVRHNTIKNVFNAIRTKPRTIREDGNGEMYGNTIINVRDNEFEPEGWAWNLHFYNNRLHNIHKQFSIDDVQGGPIYIYGNVTTQDDDEYTKKIVSGIYKFKDGPLTDNCYVFNNSFYTEARVMKEGEATNLNMKHFNNAYYFFSGSNRFQLSGWHGSFEFDYDAINQNWPPNIINNNQEQHGIITEKVFVDPENGNLHLHPESPCIDAGKIMELPELDYIQPFKGKGVDIGAYEGEEIITGPAFRYYDPPGGDNTNEKPRIVQHSVHGNTLTIVFSDVLNQNSLEEEDINVFLHHKPLQIKQMLFGDRNRDIHLTFTDAISKNGLVVQFNRLPVSAGGIPATLWAAHPMFRMTNQNVFTPEIDFPIKLTVWPNPVSGNHIYLSPVKQNNINKVSIYTSTGVLIKQITTVASNHNRLMLKLDKALKEPGIYVIRIESNTCKYTKAVFLVLP